MCQHCQALHFACEHQTCCKDGQLAPVLFPKLLEFEDIPEFFKELFDGRSEFSKEFFANIRRLNSAVSLLSMGFSGDRKGEQAIQIDCGFGGYSMVIHGSIYHQISPLLPRSNTPPTFCQILFYDSDYELQRRTEICKGREQPVSRELLERLQIELHRVNRLYKQFRAIGIQIINDPKQEVAMKIVDDFKILEIKKTEQKPYELPSASDLAVLIPANSEQKYTRDIVIQKNGNRLMRISESHPAVNPMGYVLFFPKGQLGWSPNMKYEAIEEAVPWNERANLGVREELEPHEHLDELDNEQPDNEQPDNEQPDNEQPNNEQPNNGASDDEDEESSLDECLDGLRRVSLITRSTTLTLFLFMNFFLQVRKDCFNLLLKG